MMFRALMVHQNEEGKVDGGVEMIDEQRLPQDGDVLVQVDWSNLNFKDGLCMTGGGKLVRDYPHIPGVDMAGTVLESTDERYAEGDRVLLTGWRYGEIWWGGYAEKKPGSRPTGWCPCPTLSPAARPWLSARPGFPHCSPSWRSKITASRPMAVMCW